MRVALPADAVLEEFRSLVSNARAPRLRSLRAFAEEEIIIPTGPYAGRRFRCARQPYTRAWFDAIDSGRWNRFAAVGPTQSGKSLACLVIPALYHLFEMRETVILAAPDMDIAGDKWRRDLLPVIERSRYRSLLPEAGAGSRGGRNPDSLTFRNGVTLKFMSAGGSDKRRAAYTARVVLMTEVDGFDESGSTSREADKVSQIEARTRAYGSSKRLYLECTASYPQGRIWREITGGTDSRLVLPCPHCRQWVLPEREHLRGWQEALTELEAAESAHFICPDCKAPWSEQDRREANAKLQLLHKGQTIDAEGNIHGEPPKTLTLGFRWSALHNLLAEGGEIGAEEWRSCRERDETNAEKRLRQQVWALPWSPPILGQMTLREEALLERQGTTPRGVVPREAEVLTAFCDLGQYLAHYAVVAWKSGGASTIIEYGRLEVASTDLGISPAIIVALRQFRDLCLNGWEREGGEGRGQGGSNGAGARRVQSGEGRVVPHQVWVDASYETGAVCTFIRETMGRPGTFQRFRPAMGHGAGQRARRYIPQKSTSSTVLFLGQDYHIVAHQERGVYLVHVDADAWKTFAADRLSQPVDQPGALLLHHVPRATEHLSLAKHLTAEERSEEFIADRGVMTVWKQKRAQNHWLDCIAGCSAAAHLAGYRIHAAQKPRPKPAPRRREPLRTPDGRPFCILDR